MAIQIVLTAETVTDTMYRYNPALFDKNPKAEIQATKEEAPERKAGVLGRILTRYAANRFELIKGQPTFEELLGGNNIAPVAEQTKQNQPVKVETSDDGKLAKTKAPEQNNAITTNFTVNELKNLIYSNDHAISK